MITDQRRIKDYLEAFHEGRIAMGKGIGCDLDNFLRFKQGTFNMILGHDNTGKTYWRMWYYLVLSVKYGYRWCIWTGENEAGQIVRNLIQQYKGVDFKSLSISEVYRAEQEISQWFDFVDNSHLYKYGDLLKIFGDDDYKGCLIDPYTGLDRKFGHSDNYEFLNTTREWVNRTKVTIDVCTHPSTASGRMAAIYAKDHMWAGCLRAPYKADVEGGKPFGNRCDDFITVHRMLDSPTMKHFTLIYTQKIKDTETGGAITELDTPVLCEYNYGLGFKINGIDPLRDEQYLGEIKEAKPLPLNMDFDNEKAPF